MLIRYALSALVLLAIVATVLHWHSPKAIPATWDGKQYACPAGRDLWADEGKARAGEPCAYCVR